jgi:hypothetical protein
VTGAATANFVYDGDGKPLGRACRDQVKAIVDGVTTYYVGSHYEVKNGVVTKYYVAGATRLTIRTGGTLSFLLTDHLGGTSLTTDSSGASVSELRYTPFGEIRSSWTANPSTTPPYTPTRYTFTGQYSYMDTPAPPQARASG